MDGVYIDGVLVLVKKIVTDCRWDSVMMICSIGVKWVYLGCVDSTLRTHSYSIDRPFESGVTNAVCILPFEFDHANGRSDMMVYLCTQNTYIYSKTLRTQPHELGRCRGTQRVL